MEICRLAKSCEDTTSQITNTLRTSQSEKMEHYHMICAANELVLEILHYAGCSYFATKQDLDNSVEISPIRAFSVLRTVGVVLNKVQSLVDKTLSTLIRVRNVFSGRWGSTSTVMEYQRTLVNEWDRALVLPANIRDGLTQIFHTHATLRQNNWLRRRNDTPLAGDCYPLETFTLNTSPCFHHTTKERCSEKEGKHTQRHGSSESTHYRESASYDSDDSMDMD